MAQLVVRNLTDDTKLLLKARAQHNGRSLEAEVRNILEAAVSDAANRQRVAGYVAEAERNPIPEADWADLEAAIAADRLITKVFEIED